MECHVVDARGGGVVGVDPSYWIRGCPVVAAYPTSLALTSRRHALVAVHLALRLTRLRQRRSRRSADAAGRKAGRARAKRPQPSNTSETSHFDAQSGNGELTASRAPLPGSTRVLGLRNNEMSIGIVSLQRRRSNTKFLQACHCQPSTRGLAIFSVAGLVETFRVRSGTAHRGMPMPERVI